MRTLLPVIILFLFFRGYSKDTTSIYCVFDSAGQSISIKNAPHDLPSLRSAIKVKCKRFPAGSTPKLSYSSDQNHDLTPDTFFNAATNSFIIPANAARNLLELTLSVEWITKRFTIYGNAVNSVHKKDCLVYEILNEPGVVAKRNAAGHANMALMQAKSEQAKAYIGRYFNSRATKNLNYKRINYRKLNAEQYRRIFGAKKIQEANEKIMQEKNVAAVKTASPGTSQAIVTASSVAAIDTPISSPAVVPAYIEPIEAKTDVNSSPTNLNGPDIMSNALEGITSFVVARAKQELDIAFFDKLNAYLANHPEAKILFPSTLSLLNNILSFQFNQFLPKLRQSFFEDLNNLPDNIIGLIELPKYQKLLSNFPEIRVAIESISAIRNIQSPQYHIAQLIDTLAVLSAPESGDSNVRFLDNYHATMQMINIISEAMVDPVGGQYYTKEQLESFLNEPAKLDTLIEAINTEIIASNITIYDANGFPIDISSLLSSIDLADKNVIIRAFLQNVAIAVDDLRQAEDALNSLAASGSGSANVKTAALAYMDAAVHCVDVMGNVFNLFDSTDVSAYTGMIHSLFLIPEDALNQDYPSLVFNTIGFVQTTLEMCAADSSNNKAIKNSLGVISQITTYGNLAANIIQAKTSDDVMNAITAVALPPGSSSIKKASLFNVSIQMHLGGAITAHNFGGTQAAPSWKNLLNVSLPVGISVNTGFGKGGSLGAFFSIIDLGAIAQEQINADSTGLNEKITIQNVFSPGIMLSYGFSCNVPLSLNFGGQYGPGLTSITSAGPQIMNPSWRLIASLTVDIPAFTVYNIAKVKRQVIQKAKRKKSFITYGKAED